MTIITNNKLFHILRKVHNLDLTDTLALYHKLKEERKRHLDNYDLEQASEVLPRYGLPRCMEKYLD